MRKIMTMNIKNLLIGSAALLSLAACSNDDEQPVSAPQYEIHLMSDMTEHETTRATGSYTNGFLPGTEFYVWADMTDEGEEDPLYRVKEYISSWPLTVNSDDYTHFDSQYTKLFPVYNKLSFYAMHGNFGENVITANASTFPGLLTHNVKTDQKEDLDYLASDLVYATKADVVPQADSIALHFYHLLSKVEVVLMPGNQMDENDLKNVASTKVTVSLVNTKTAVEFRPKKSEGKKPDTEADRISMLTPIGSTKEITMSTTTTDDFSSATCAAAIVVPQTVNGRFIKLSYQNRDTYYSVNNLELRSGYRYRFNLTVDRIGTTYTITKIDNQTSIMQPWDNQQAAEIWIE